MEDNGTIPDAMGSVVRWLRGLTKWQGMVDTVRVAAGRFEVRLQGAVERKQRGICFEWIFFLKKVWCDGAARWERRLVSPCIWGRPEWRWKRG